MYTFNCSGFSYSLDERGSAASFVPKGGCELISRPAPIWRMIVSDDHRPERPIFADEQSPELIVGDELIVRYPYLVSEGERFDISLELRIYERRGGLAAEARIKNDSPFIVTELMLAPIAGFSSIDGHPESDYLMFPSSEGQRIDAPSLSDLSVYAGFRKYERHDWLHTDLDRLYPGPASMQWYSITAADASPDRISTLYCASEDDSGQTVDLHVERRVADNTLSLGFIRYPFLKTGEEILLPPLCYIPTTGDWHRASKLYREWIEGCGYWRPPVIPDWMRRFEGWLRVIMKPHHLELNWDYSKIPELYDECEAAGLDTLYLLGWEKGGFARMWPDFIPDDTKPGEYGLGSVDTLRAGIEYVHQKGGRVAMFLSYLLLDTESEFYKSGGEDCLVKNLWGKPTPFAETYCGEGSWRKLGAPPMPMYAACSGSDKWNAKMKEAAKVCLELGADAVLYDIGGFTPHFCFAEGHDHDRPSMSMASKARRYAELRSFVKSYGEDRAIYMEHNVDIFGQSMELAHSSSTRPRSRGCRPEMYRYTFPELNLTNRELGQDDSNYADRVNYTYLYGMSFDMTIYRCCGTFKDIPEYTAYMKQVIGLRRKNEKYFHFGRFIDTDGFTLTGDAEDIEAKAYLAADGSIGVALWNCGKTARSFSVKIGDVCLPVRVEPDRVDFVHN